MKDLHEGPAQTAPTTDLTSSQRSRRKAKIGRVKSNKMQKSIVVVTETRVAHPLYRKTIRRSKHFVAHDERNEANVGDLVRIVETRPTSATKRWRLAEILEKAK